MYDAGALGCDPLAGLWPVPDRHTLEAIPGGSAGTRATMDRMRQLVLDARATPAIRNLALSIVRAAGLPNYDYAGQAQALQAWVQQNIAYVRDVDGVETLTPPAYTLGLRAGDCDDQAMLLAALASSVGYKARFVAGGLKPGSFVHVWCELQVDGEWLPAETTRPLPLGEFPKLPYRMAVDV